MPPRTHGTHDATRSDVVTIAVPSRDAAATRPIASRRPARRTVCSSVTARKLTSSFCSGSRPHQPLERFHEALEPDLQPLRLVEEHLRIDLRAHAPHDAAHQEPAGDVERIDLGIQLCGRQLHLRQRLRGQRQRRRQRDPVPQRDLGHLLQRRAELDVLQRRAAILRHDRADLALERVDVEVAAVDRARQHERDVGEEPDVLLPEGHQQQHHVLAHLGVDLAGHAEIQEVEAVLLRLPHQVPRMRVGVEEPVDHHLLVEGLQELHGGLVADRALGGDRDRPAAHVAHHEEPRRGVVRIQRPARPAARTARRYRAAAPCSAPPAGSRARGATTSTGARRRPPCRSPA